MNVTLAQAQKIIEVALAHAAEVELSPLAIGVLDSRGVLIAYAAQQTGALRRADIALGKARGALNFGFGSRRLMQIAAERPHFLAAVNTAFDGNLIPVPGGVLIKSGGAVIGAVGVSGDSSDNDEAAALAGIEAAGLQGDGG